MKKILTALALVGLTYCGANAQTSTGKVCRMSPNKKSTSCYTTKYAENFKVCKSDYGYFICDEVPGNTNATHPELPLAGVVPYQTQGYQYGNATAANTSQMNMIAPQSQSYPDISVTNARSYEGYYPKKNYIRACYGGDNVAENNRMPYQGCPSPQYDGPDKNNARNINESNPINLPGIPGVKD